MRIFAFFNNIVNKSVEQKCYKMIKKVLIGLLLPATLWANNHQLNDLYEVKDSIPIEFYFSDLDKNLDSVMRVWYSQESVGSDPIISEMAHDVLPFVPELNDSIIIQRLQNIPTVVNLTYNNVVRSFINVYTRRSRLETLLGLSEYYFPMFDEILDFHDVPLELKYLAVIESALNPTAVSRAGATGIWQFMPGTGRLYKLQLTTFVDERRDPVKSTHAAARYLKDLYNIYNDWALALAAYNCGPGNVNKAIRRSGGKTSYWEIYPHLPRETRGYVPAYIGALYAMTYHKEHNVFPRVVDVPPVSDTIMVHRNVSLTQVAQVLDIPLKTVRDLNPQYRREMIPGNSAPYPLRLPALYATKFIDMQDEIYLLSSSFKIEEPRGGGSSSGGGSSVNTAGKDRVVHTVRSGENLGVIARRYNVSVNNLQSWNRINGTKIVVGQKLVVYTNPKTAPSSTATATASSSTTNNNNSSNVTASTGGNVTWYTVQKGDSVWKIAQKYNGVTDNDILKWNNLTRQSKINPGQKLKIIQ